MTTAMVRGPMPERGVGGRLRSGLLAGLLFGWSCLSLGAEESGAADASVWPEHYVPLVEVLAGWGLTPRPAAPGDKTRVFGNAWRELRVRTDSRQVYLNDRRIFLGEGILIHEGRLGVSAIDVDTLLRPVMRPEDFAVGARPVHTIWIDAGHGGKDRGTFSDPLQLREKDVALDVALRLGEILAAQGFAVRHTRTEDVYVDIGDRGEMSRGADLMVSIHFNAAGNPQARGSEVYALTPAGQRSTGDRSGPDGEYPVERGNATDPWNAMLGFAVHDAMVSHLGTVDRGLKRARFAVLRLTDVPAVLIEAGFLSNAAEAQEIASAERRREIAEAIANGIVNYANLMLSLSPES